MWKAILVVSGHSTSQQHLSVCHRTANFQLEISRCWQGALRLPISVQCTHSCHCGTRLVRSTTLHKTCQALQLCRCAAFTTCTGACCEAPVGTAFPPKTFVTVIIEVCIPKGVSRLNAALAARSYTRFLSRALLCIIRALLVSCVRKYWSRIYVWLRERSSVPAGFSTITIAKVTTGADASISQHLKHLTPSLQHFSVYTCLQAY